VKTKGSRQWQGSILRFASCLLHSTPELRQGFFKQQPCAEESFRSSKNSSWSWSGKLSIEELFEKELLTIGASPFSSKKYHCMISTRVSRCWEISSFSNWSSVLSDSSIILRNFSDMATFPRCTFLCQFCSCIWSLKTTLKFEHLLSLQVQIQAEIYPCFVYVPHNVDQRSSKNSTLQQNIEAVARDTATTPLRPTGWEPKHV